MKELVIIKQTLKSLITEYAAQSLINETERNKGCIDGLNISLGIVNSAISIQKGKNAVKQLKRKSTQSTTHQLSAKTVNCPK